MKFVLKLLVFIFFIINAGSVDLDQFYNYVLNKINNTKYYQQPTDNEKIFNISSTIKYDYGCFDFIIVGAGAGGSVLANRLSEIKEWNVLLLEAGGKTNNFSDVPSFSHYLKETDMNWGYFSTPQRTFGQGMENNQIFYPRGKVIGGTTTINGAAYVRGSSSDYDNWAALGNPGWSYQDILPYFKKSEHIFLQSYDTFYHGTKGPLYVNQTYPPSVTADIFLKAHLEKGLKQVDYNGKEQLGVSRIQFNQKDNKHQNSEHAFLDDIKNRKNLKIVLNAGVNKILLENNVARGVDFVLNGKIYRAKANKEVILSAGSINTPQLLIISGIGPEDDLVKLGIPLVKNLPAVGKHLKDHPSFINIYFRTNLTAPDLSLKENLARYLNGKTPLTNTAGMEQLSFINLNNIPNGNADVEFITYAPPFSVPPNPKMLYNFKKKFVDVFKKYNTLSDFAVIIVLLQPKSEGSVTLKSNNIKDFPLIDLNYYSDPDGADIETMYKGIKYVLGFLDTKAFQSVNATLVSEQPNCEHLRYDDKKYWYCAIRHMTGTLYHPAGTTRMGPSEADFVVNKECIVHGFKNLRVVDAGVMPYLTRGHLMSAVYMIAEKISESIKRKYNIFNER